jgi:inhibitor of nuclear factor kappa-B kinase subunit alpha
VWLVAPCETFCRENFHDFVPKEEWPAASPDINPCDFFLWGWLEQLVCFKKYPSVSQLKTAILRAWQKLDQDVIVSACVHSFSKRLNLLIKEKGGFIEHLV